MTATVDASGHAKVAFWNNPNVRSTAFQIMLVLILAVLVYEIVVNTTNNLKSRNIASGWDFLTRTAGFDIIQPPIEYSSASSYGRALMVGFTNTIILSFFGIIFATILGFTMGVARLSKNWVVAKIGTLYVEIFRNVPLLFWIFFFYSAILQPLPGPKQALNVLDGVFLSNRGLMMPRPIFGEGAWAALAALIVGIVAAIMIARWSKARQLATGQTFPVLWTALALIIGLPLIVFTLLGFPVTWDVPQLKGFNFAGGFQIIPEFIAMLVALSVYTGTFIAEAVRAGIQAISHGQTEASYALGLRPGKALRLVVIPQAMRVIIPPLTSTYLSLTKNSSLAIAIGFPDLVATGGTVLNQTGQAIEIVGIWMTVYLSLSLLTSLLMNWFNSTMKLVER